MGTKGSRLTKCIFSDIGKERRFSRSKGESMSLLLLPGSCTGACRHAGESGSRVFTRGVCGDTSNGLVAIWNWAELGDGTHTAVVYDNGVEFDRSTFEVATLGETFVRGADARSRTSHQRERQRRWSGIRTPNISRWWEKISQTFQMPMRSMTSTLACAQASVK